MSRLSVFLLYSVFAAITSSLAENPLHLLSMLMSASGIALYIHWLSNGGNK